MLKRPNFISLILSLLAFLSSGSVTVKIWWLDEQLGKLLKSD